MPDTICPVPPRAPMSSADMVRAATGDFNSAERTDNWTKATMYYTRALALLALRDAGVRLPS